MPDPGASRLSDAPRLSGESRLSGEPRSPGDELAAAAAAGDRAAWSRLVVSLTPRLIGFLKASGLRPAEAEDVAQDAWLRVWNHIDDYDRTRPFRPWLFQIARNHALTQRRSAARRALRERDRGETAAPAPQPHEGLERQETVDAVTRCLGGLSEVERTCLTLRYREGLKNHEVADRLATPKGTVDGAFSRGLKKMSDCLSRPASPPPPAAPSAGPNRD
ncbi:RNA polymerase sigma factor [Alienimonas sp. DA493]|uniref:RNA polymerase sigma factor n=1 Tax=Alienimonas sp. DA493 TaxID=3373605 RepID=UPI003753FB61